jgi:hypothetical protein
VYDIPIGPAIASSSVRPDAAELWIALAAAGHPWVFSIFFTWVNARVIVALHRGGSFLGEARDVESGGR